MTNQTLRTIWFTRDSLITIAILLPIWALAAVMWGTIMALLMRGSLFGWLIAGVFWGVSCWFFTAILALIGLRELVIRVPAIDSRTLGDRLAQGAKKIKYAVEQTSPYQYVCKPTRGLTRHIAGYGWLQVDLHQEGIDLIGPAVVVNRVRKVLQKA